MKWLVGLSFIALAAFCLYQNKVIKESTQSLVYMEKGAMSMVAAYQSASMRSNKWEQRYYSCVKLQVVSAP
jgi:hypothetical protein